MLSASLNKTFLSLLKDLRYNNNKVRNDALNAFYLRLYGVGHNMVKIHSDIERERKEGNVLFNDALNTFYLRLYGVGHMVKDHSDSEKGNPLPPHRLLFPISSKGSFICTIPQTGNNNKVRNDALNAFYLRLYGVGHNMVKIHSDIEREKPAVTTTWATLSNY